MILPKRGHSKPGEKEENVPEDHPRKESLEIRDKLVSALEEGITSRAGLIAHGRGEAFDYLLGEKTQPEAEKAIEAAAAQLLLAENPVISVNGNTVALASKEIVELSEEVDAKIEINLFHPSRDRARKIKVKLVKNGADKVFGLEQSTKKKIPGVSSNRALVDPEGIEKADVVLVPLEDGGRTEALTELEKQVIAIDLNPLSRTAEKADITIVDNLIRAVPLLKEKASQLKEKDSNLQEILEEFDNNQNLEEITNRLRQGNI